MEGDGRKLKVVITKRSRGLVCWIRFGEEVLKNLLNGIEICSRDMPQTRGVLDWKETGRFYSLDFGVHGKCHWEISPMFSHKHGWEKA